MISRPRDASKAHGRSPGFNDAFGAAMRIEQTLPVAEMMSRQIWNDGPHVRHRAGQPVPGHALWSGWPSDEITMCYRKLAADIAQQPHPRRKRRKD